MKILKFKNKQKFRYSKKIIVKDLILLISVGIHNFEKLKKQKVKFNLTITTDPNLKSENLDEDEKTKLMCLSGVKQYPMRVKCATLSWHTLVSAFEDKKDEVKTEN